MPRVIALFAMGTEWFLGFVGEDERAVSVDLAVGIDSSLDALLEACESKLGARPFTRGRIVLGLSEYHCLASRSPTIRAEGRLSGLARFTQRAAEARKYALEELIPWAAEDFVADAINHDDGQMFAVCCKHAEVAHLITRLEDCQVVVTHVVPTSLLAAQYFVSIHTDRAGALTLEAPAGSCASQCVVLRKSLPYDWHLVANTGAHTAGDVGVQGDREDRRDRSLVVRLISGSEDARADGHTEVEPPATGGTSIAEHTVRGAIAIADGSLRPWINLRRDELAARLPLHEARRAINVASTVIFCSAVAVCAGLFIRSAKYDQLASRARDERAALYREAIPSGFPPLDTGGRLRAEERRLSALRAKSRTEATENRETPDSFSASDSLLRTLSVLPSDMRFRILEMRLDADKFYIEGEARSHADAEALAAAMQRSGEYVAGTPRSEQRGDRGVGFVLTGNRLPQGSGLAVPK